MKNWYCVCLGGTYDSRGKEGTGTCPALASKHIYKCQNASLDISELMGKFEDAKTVAQATMLLGALKEPLSKLCYELDPDPVEVWYAKEHR